MFVGIGYVVLRLSGARSLKDRRRVVSSYKDRLRARLSVSVAEVGDVENPKLVQIGVALVAREAGEAELLLDRALGMAEQLKEALVVDVTRRVLPWQATGFGSDEEWPDSEDE